MGEAIIWAVIVGGTVVGLYAIHRRYRWLAERGFVDDTKATGGGPFMALREFIEPSAQQIQRIHEEKRHQAEAEAPGEAEPPNEEPPVAE